MHLAQIKVENFRGISAADVSLDGNTVLLGDNNSGKSTLLEAVELALGADRLFRRPVIDEHDFYGGAYLDNEIRVEGHFGRIVQAVPRLRQHKVRRSGGRRSL